MCQKFYLELFTAFCISHIAQPVYISGQTEKLNLGDHVASSLHLKFLLCDIVDNINKEYIYL